MTRPAKATLLLIAIAAAAVVVAVWLLMPTRKPGPNGTNPGTAHATTQPPPRVPTFPDVPPSSEPDGPRIVLLSPAFAVTARDMGLEKFIVGRHAYDVVLDPSLPVCGDQSGIDYEALLRARPSRIWIEWGSRPLPARLAELASQNSWAITTLNALSIEDVQAAARELKQRVVAPLSARGLLPTNAGDDVLASLDRAGSKRFETPPPGRVLLLGATDPPSAFGPGAVHYEILRRMGATPAITEGSPYITLDAEDVLRLAPDVIVIVEPRDRATPSGPRDIASLKARLGRVGTLEVPAVKKGRLGLIDDPLCQMPSTAMARFADELEAELKRMP